MKFTKKIIAGISAVLLAVCCVPANLFQENADAAVDDNNDDWLHVEGNKILDMNGNEVWLTGANWFGFNCSENVFHGAWVDVRTIIKSIADHGINVVRVPISTELLLSWMNGTPNPVSSVTATNNPPYYVVNPEFVVEGTTKDVKNSMEIFDACMAMFKEYGIKIIVDIHSPDANNSGHNYELWYNDEFSTEDWINSLAWLAEKYKNDDTIVGYDLKNEPHGSRGYDEEVPELFAKWDDSTDLNNWKYAAERCGKAILEANPNALIIVEGTQQYPKTDEGYTFATPDIWGASAEQSPWYNAWWGGNLRGVKDNPVDLGENQDQLVYSPHDYGPSVYAQPWFDKDFTTQTLLDDYWYDSWAYINDQNIAPLLMGEWGGHMDGGDNQKWMTLLRDYMKENRINHTFWCINPNSGDTGGLLDSSFLNWDEEKYGLLEEALWQTDEGKYIGLDHKTPLGVNGTTVSEYYNEGNGNQGDDDDVTGDVNGDKAVNMADLILVKKYVLGATDTISKLADVNADSSINSTDIVLYKKFLLGKITSF